MDHCSEEFTPQKIADDSWLLRHCLAGHRKGPKKRKYPAPNHFALRKGEQGLSFSWRKICNPGQHMTVLGLTHNKDGNFIRTKDFRLFQFELNFLRRLEGVASVEHDPVCNGNTAPVGKPNNPGHCQLFFNQPDDPEVRNHLSRYCQENLEHSSCTLNYDHIDSIVECLREKSNKTTFHKCTNWGVI